jgi:hypothetical protein
MKIEKEHLLFTAIFIVGIIVRILKFDDPDLVMDTVAYSRLGKNGKIIIWVFSSRQDILYL